MGIYDRDYYRQGRSGFQLRAPRTAIGAIILLNVAVFVLEIVDEKASNHPLVVDILANHVRISPPQTMAPASGSAGLQEIQLQVPWWEQDTLSHPWLWWQFLTYGFVHSPGEMQHIVFNMLTLFFLGRDVEEWYGTREFIRLYLVMLAFAGVAWAVANHLFAPPFPSHTFPDGQRILYSITFQALGASGAIAGVVVLYALNFPKRILLLMFVLPVPAWLVGALVIAYDIWGAWVAPGKISPFPAHLGGAALALAYFNFHWNFGQLLARGRHLAETSLGAFAQGLQTGK